MIVLIAGGAGFIGSNLCKKLLNENNNIIYVDNLYTGKLENPLFTFIEHDITIPIPLNKGRNRWDISLSVSRIPSQIPKRSYLYT